MRLFAVDIKVACLFRISAALSCRLIREYGVRTVLVAFR